MTPMIEWLYGLQHFGVKLGLENIRALLSALGDPQSAYPSIHVAGTNGKGSVAAMLDAMLAASGLRAGLFTSPHLVHPSERIRIAGRDIDEDELDARLGTMRRAIERALARGDLEVHPSFFEVITATALQAFAEHRLDAAVLEVGLGGRLDATNAVCADVGVIVSVSLDHTKTLGDTPGRIAAEKAGIIEEGMPVVCGLRPGEALEVVERICRERGAERIDALVRTAVDTGSDGRLTIETAERRYEGLELTLAGGHQVDNARVAIVALEQFLARRGTAADPRSVRRGLAAVRWPGRLQWFEPVDGARLLLDAAHNPAGMAALVDYLERQRLPGAVLLFGATRGKPVPRLLEPLQRFVDTIVLTRPPVEKALDPVELAVEADGRFERIEVREEIGEALELARRLAGEDRFVLVTGSLYLVGEVLGRLRGGPVPGPIAM